MTRYRTMQLVQAPANRTVDGQQKWAKWPQPLGILSIATTAQERIPGIEIEVLDFESHLNMDNEQDLARFGNVDIVGISVNFSQIDRAIELAKIAKSRGAVTVLGGMLVSALNTRILKYHDCVDYLITHDGEDAWCELIKGTALHNIPNLIWRDNGVITQNKYGEVNLRALPIINRDYIDFEAYVNLANVDTDFKPLPYFSRPTNIYSLKGCSWRAQEGGGCYFCSIHDRGLRSRAPKQVWDERIQLANKYGVNFIWDSSDNFVADPEWFDEFVKLQPKDFCIPFSHYIRIDCVTPEIALKLRKIGTKQVF